MVSKQEDMVWWESYRYFLEKKKKKTDISRSQQQAFIMPENEY